MVFFKKKKDKIQAGVANAPMNKLVEKIAGAGLKMQATLSDRMNRLFMKMGTRTLKMVIVVFCLFGGGFSMYLVIGSILIPEKGRDSFKIDRMNVPQHYDHTGDESIRQDVKVDEQTYHQLLGFTVYMDSLKINKKNIYDSILQARPGLMDSVQMLFEIYDSQKIK